MITFSPFLVDYILRLCAAPYNLDDLTNHYALVSNHCIQATASEGYGDIVEGNEAFRSHLVALLSEQCGGDPELGRQATEQIERGMHDIVRYTVAACADFCEPSADSFASCQILGYDFIVDEDRKVLLLEVNGSPAVATKLAPPLAREVVRKVLYPAVGLDPTWTWTEREDPLGGGDGGRHEGCLVDITDPPRDV